MERIRNQYSLHKEHDPSKCPALSHNGVWRTVECDGVKDIVECSSCGKQKEVSCNFDEEYS